MKIGNVYNYWTVVDEPKQTVKPSGQIYLKIPCVCICGKKRDINKFSLTSGRSQSCGCVTYPEHGKSNTRLYHCWENMKQRARLRTKRGDTCRVCEDWLSFEGFELWALTNGYNDKLELLRGTPENPDQGDYAPDNARWGTHKQNYEDYRLSKSNI